MSSLKPFRFKAMWANHNNYEEIIKNNWQLEGNLSEKLQCLAEKLKKWNTDCFSCQFHNKMRLVARLQGIQKILCGGYNLKLAKLEDKLIDDYNNTLDQELTF
ncbi:hypothetical protein ACOSQ2_007210 [Xanthoceras sorbifolium]